VTAAETEPDDVQQDTPGYTSEIESVVQPETIVTSPEPILTGPEEIPVQPETAAHQPEPFTVQPETIEAEPEPLAVQDEPVFTKQEPVPVQPVISEQLDENQEDPDDTGAAEHVHPEEEKLAFQAYHTVDYFASQGIRLSHEVKTEDKLGKQMKSFTEWLKTMRRLPQATVEEVLDKTNDKEIEQIAADSLEDNEVLTETMALVLARQGKIAMAREIYNKLSLLNPHKSAYFAAKIEDLNKHLS
jgi:hypothetical protein